MRQCLDEGMLQSYFDGELSASLMESAAAHLSSCVTCAAAARELEQENALLSEAFAMEFDGAVPSERLRRRVDAAVAGIQIVRPVVQQSTAGSGFLTSLSNLFSFAPQRAFGFAALMVVLAFGVIFGLVKFKNSTQKGASEIAGQQKTIEVAPPTTASEIKNQNEAVAGTSRSQSSPAPINVVRKSAVTKSNAPRLAPPKPAPVQLLPGERAYLQTIAKLDTTINEGKKNMRPALQVEYERNLALVNQAIAATRSTAKQNPRDPDAADFMFAAYQSKVDLLNTIADARVYNRSH